MWNASERSRERLKEKAGELFFASGYTQDVIPVEDIVNGLVKLKNGDYIKILEINPKGFSKLKNRDKNATINSYRMFLRNAPGNMQFKVITEKTDTHALLAPYVERYEHETDPVMKLLREDNLKLVTRLSTQEAVTKRYFLIIRYEGNPYSGTVSSDPAQIALDMKSEENEIDAALRACGNSIIRHTNEREFIEETLYRHFNRRSSASETVSERKGRLRRDISDLAFYYGDTEKQLYVPVTSVIAPRGIEPFYDCMVADGKYFSYLTIREDGYPQRVYASWVDMLTNINCDFDMYLEEQPKDQMINSLERSISQHSVLAKYQTERSGQGDLSDAIAAADYMIQALRTSEKFYYCTVIITVTGDTKEELITNRGTMIRSLNSTSIKCAVAKTDLMDYFRMTMPLMQINKRITARFRHNMTTEGVAGCYPFDEQRLRDEDGMVIGRNRDNASLALYNPFDTNRYNNANIGIFGTSGSGKTFFSLMLATRLRLNDIGVFFVLPEKGYEYKRAVQFMNGTFIDFSAGSEQCINIFDIMAEADLDAQTMADFEVTKRSKLQQKIVEIKTFFELIFNRSEGMDPIRESLLTTALTELYAQYGITTDNRSLYGPDGRKKTCPTIGEFYEYIKDDPDMREFITVLKPYITGTKSNLNGQTNIDLTGKVIAFDVTNNDKQDLPLFLFLALNLCYSKMKENRTDRYALFIDEGWKMLVNRNAAEFINELIKIVRGYAGSAIFATQNLGDVVSAPGGQSIISNLQAKFLLKIGNGEEEINKSLFLLTDEEVKRISEQKKGTITFLANKENYQLLTAASARETDLYTTDPHLVKAAHQRINEELKTIGKYIKDLNGGNG